MKEKHYKAFISYSHKDEKFGNWLHKSLEKYKIPKELREDYPNLPKSLFPIFRDREELSVDADLKIEILKALKNSEYLIIICSVNSAKSEWVNKEIIDFKMEHGEDKVRAIILNGEPHAKDNDEFDDELECFPEALKYKVIDGKLSNVPTEPIAGDFRKGKDGREQGKLKLLAGLLAVDFDELNRREEKRKRRSRFIWGVVAISLIAVMAGLTVYSFIQRDRALEAEKLENIRTKEAIKKKKIAKENKKILTKNLVTQALMYRDKSENLKFKHSLAKAIGNISNENNISYIKFMYLDNSFSLGKIIKYIDLSFVNYFDNNGTKKSNQMYHSIISSNENFLLELYKVKDYDYTLDLVYIDIWDIEKKEKIFTLVKKDINKIAFLEDDKIIFQIRTPGNHYKYKIWNFKTKSENKNNKNNFLNINFIGDFEYYNSKDYDYLEYGYNIQIFSRDYASSFHGYKIKKGREVETKFSAGGADFLHKPIIIPDLDIVILSGKGGGSGNFGAEVRIDKIQNKNSYKSSTYSNYYNLEGMNLSKDKKFLMTYTSNQLNISKIDSQEATTIQIDKRVHGVLCLKNNLMLYWVDNKITIIKVYNNNYEKILIIKTLSKINSVSFNEKANKLIVRDRNTLSTWDISTILNPNDITYLPLEFETKNYIRTDYIRGDDNIKNTILDFKNYIENKELKIFPLKVVIKNIENNQSIYSVKHNLLPNKVNIFGKIVTYAKLLPNNKNRLLSFSCFEEAYSSDDCTCSLYLTDIKSKINIFKKSNESCYIDIGRIFIPTKLYEEKSINLENKYFQLKTIVDTGTEYLDSGKLRVLTPKEWLQKKKEYEQILKESNK